MGIFNSFFERLINDIDDVKDLDEQEAEEVKEAASPSESVDASTNADLRARTLRNVELQSEDEDPFYQLLRRRLERSRNSSPIEWRTESNTEEQSGTRFRPPLSWDVSSAPASATSWFENSASPTVNYPAQPPVTPGILGQSATGIFVDDINVHRASQNMARQLDQQLIDNLIAARNPQPLHISAESISITGNQDYLQLESQIQEYASLVKELLDSATPEDYRIQSQRVRESTDLILSRREVKESNPTTKNSTSVEIELD